MRTPRERHTRLAIAALLAVAVATGACESLPDASSSPTPNASFVPGYEPMRVETKDDVITGNIVREDATAVVVKLNAALEQRIPRGDIRSITPGTVSVMPEGLVSALTKDELRDLLAFVQAQNGEQWLQPQRRGK